MEAINITENFYKKKEKFLKNKAEQMRKKALSAKKIFKKYNVNAYLFGSVSKGKVDSNSDFDFYIEGLKNQMDFFKILNELEEHLKEKVDLISDREVNDSIKTKIKKEGISVYEK